MVKAYDKAKRYNKQTDICFRFAWSACSFREAVNLLPKRKEALLVSFDFGTLHVNAVIVHDVPKRTGKEKADIDLSETISELNDDLRNYFMERLKQSLTSSSFNVGFITRDDNVVAKSVTGCFSCEDDDQEVFVEQSRAIATHLYDCQNGQNPGGLLAVILGSIDDSRAIGILKLEKEAAVRLEKTKSASGRMTFSLEHLRELTLSDKTRVFKVGLFAQDNSLVDTNGYENVRGVVCDKQQSQRGRFGVAHFFLDRFLGCELSTSPDVSTKKVYDTTSSYINEHIVDPDQKSKCRLQLVAEMDSNDPDIDLVPFAQRVFADAHRQGLLNAFKEAGILDKTIKKDASLVRSEIKTMRVLFDSGIALSIPPKAFDDHVEILKLENGKTDVVIHDEVKDIR